MSASTCGLKEEKKQNKNKKAKTLYMSTEIINVHLPNKRNFPALLYYL